MNDTSKVKQRLISVGITNFSNVLLFLVRNEKGKKEKRGAQGLDISFHGVPSSFAIIHEKASAKIHCYVNVVFLKQSKIEGNIFSRLDYD